MVDRPVGPRAPAGRASTRPYEYPVDRVRYPGEPASGPGAIRRPSRKGCTMPGVISVGLPDGSTRELAEGTTAAELARSIGSRLAKAAVVATVDGHEVDLSTVLPDGAKVAIV